jgi:hypothetical protein
MEIVGFQFNICLESVGMSGPILLQGILIGQPQTRVGGYKLHPVPLFCGEKLKTGKNEHLLLSITFMICPYFNLKHLIKTCTCIVQYYGEWE